MQNLVKREIVEHAVFMVAIVIAFSIVLFIMPSQQGRTYDCGMAEWHPDIPTKVKEECRKLRAENFNKDLNKPK